MDSFYAPYAMLFLSVSLLSSSSSSFYLFIYYSYISKQKNNICNIILFKKSKTREIISCLKTLCCEILKYLQVYEPYRNIVWQERDRTHRNLNECRKIN